jgi:hypothetical protein
VEVRADQAHALVDVVDGTIEVGAFPARLGVVVELVFVLVVLRIPRREQRVETGRALDRGS